MTAIVTGSAAGIGRAISTNLAALGAHVILADLAPAEVTAQQIRRAGGRADVLTCDIGDEISVARLARDVAALSDGRPDILVNNAGVNGECHLVQDMPLATWEKTLRVNVTGTMLVSRSIVPMMIARGTGTIVNVASNVARRGLPFRADYVCSKWAVLGLTQTLALELGHLGIRVNAVCPGPVEGDRIEQLLEAHAVVEHTSAAEIRRIWAQGSPMNRFIEPREVADVVAFLCGSESSSLTGQALNVTAGALMT